MASTRSSSTIANQSRAGRAAGVDLELRSLPEGQHKLLPGGRQGSRDRRGRSREMGAWLRLQDRPGGGPCLNGPAARPASRRRDAACLCYLGRDPANKSKENASMRAGPGQGIRRALKRWWMIPAPEPGARPDPDQLLAGRGHEPHDLWLASGAWKPMPATFPMVLGADWGGRGRKARRRCFEVLPWRRSVRPVADRPAWLGGWVPTPSTWPLARMAPLARVPSGLG